MIVCVNVSGVLFLVTILSLFAYMAILSVTVVPYAIAVTIARYFGTEDLEPKLFIFVVVSFLFSCLAVFLVAWFWVHSSSFSLVPIASIISKPA